MSQFPDGEHATRFVKVYADAVRKRSRWFNRDLRHGVVVLRAAPDSARVALKALEGALKRPGRTVLMPGALYARVPRAEDHRGWSDGSLEELIRAVVDSLRKNAPVEAGKLRLPLYDLLSAVAAELASRPAGVRTEVDEDFRMRVYEKAERRASPDGDAGNSPLYTLALGPLSASFNLRGIFKAVHKRCWERRRQHRLSRAYFNNLWGEGGGGARLYSSALERLVDVFKDAVPGDSRSGLRNELWLQALLVDLHFYGHRGLMVPPGRRRRRRRRVLLFDGTGPVGAGVVHDFIELYRKLQTPKSCPNPATLLVAALPHTLPRHVPVGTTTHDDWDGLANGLSSTAGDQLKWHELVLAEGVPTASVQIGPIRRTPLRLKPRNEVASDVALALALVGLWFLGVLVHLPVVGDFLGRGPILPGDECLVATDPQKGGMLSPGAPQVHYRAALKLIEDGNKAAELRAPAGRIVTIGHIRSALPPTDEEQRAGGSISELRGLAIAQRLVNAQAPVDDNGIWIRIKSYDAGVQFQDAPAMAKQIVADKAKDPTFIGVAGFTESRKVTVQALVLLDEAKVPIMSSTATAKRMEVGRMYHGVAPNNEREAQVAAQFVDKANTVRTGTDTCAPAERAVVVTDPADEYSDELSEFFVKQFPHTGNRIGYTPVKRDSSIPEDSDIDRQYSIDEVARKVCERVKNAPRSVVYWTARVREFKAFLTSYETATNCANQNLTVVGGNELTNSAISGSFQEKSWLSLYHTAHSLQVGDKRNSDKAKAFQRAYTEEFGKQDIWRNDGHAALAHDAVQVLAQAANRTNAADQELSMANIQNRVTDGPLDLEGASGRLRFSGGSRPTDKLLVMVHHKDGGSAPVLVCGAPGKNIDAGKEWKQGRETYACPKEN